MLANEVVFDPDWFSPPGTTILAAAKKREISTDTLAKQLGLTLRETKSLLLGDRSIDNELATRLAQVIGGSATFWNNRQSDFELSLRSCADRFRADEIADLANTLPLKDMRKLGWLNPNTSPSVQALAFFDVRSPDAWKQRYQDRVKAVAFRQSAYFEADPNSTLAWLRQAERLASLISCRDWDRAGFENELIHLRAFTKRRRPSKFFPDLVERCAKHGVAVVFVPSPSGCRASGATFFVGPKKAVIVLSFRYLTDDQFWFSFFHEAAHLILHDERALFLEDTSGVTDDAEREANAFAAELLVPSAYRPELESLPAKSNAIIRFAVRMGISPGVVVGQMQHAGIIMYNQMNGLKRRYSRDELASTL